MGVAFISLLHHFLFGCGMQHTRPVRDATQQGPCLTKLFTKLLNTFRACHKSASTTKWQHLCGMGEEAVHSGAWLVTGDCVELQTVDGHMNL